MSDLDAKEQQHVRTALRYLRRRCGGWASVGKALRYSPDTLEKVVNGRKHVSASMALRAARLAGVSMDDLLAGKYLPGACPKCGHVPDFADEPTQIEPAPRRTRRGGDEGDGTA